MSSGPSDDSQTDSQPMPVVGTVVVEISTKDGNVPGTGTCSYIFFYHLVSKNE